MEEQQNGQTSRALTAADIRAARDVTIKRVEVPEWGGHIFVRTMTALAKENYLARVREVVQDPNGGKPYFKLILPESGAYLASLTVCDEGGNLLFSSEDDETIQMFNEKSSAAMDRVVEAAGKLNGLTDDSAAKAKNDSQVQQASASSSN